MGDFGIGLYNYNESPLWYRPHQSCKMRFLGYAFCAVCQEGIIEQIHSMVSPVVSYSPQPTQLYPSDMPLSFKLNLIKPFPNTLEIEWVLNNLTVARNIDSVLIDADDLNGTSNFLKVIVEDTTELLRVDNHNSIHFSIVSWNIGTPSYGTGNLVLSSNVADIKIYPNPFFDRLNIEFKEDLNEKLKLEIVDMTGRIKDSYLFSPQKTYTINTANLKEGYFTIKFLYPSGFDGYT
jgi:hypothetical protein